MIKVSHLKDHFILERRLQRPWRRFCPSSQRSWDLLTPGETYLNIPEHPEIFQAERWSTQESLNLLRHIWRLNFIWSFFNSYWNIVDLKCCVSFRYTVKWDINICEHCSVVSDSLRPHGLHSPWNSPGQDTGVGSLSLLQGIFPTQWSNPGLPHCRQILYQLTTRETHIYMY